MAKSDNTDNAPSKEHKALQKDLKRIIRRMKKIQKNIASDGQPPSMLEIEELSNLGRQYGDIVQVLRTCYTSDQKEN